MSSRSLLRRALPARVSATLTLLAALATLQATVGATPALAEGSFEAIAPTNVGISSATLRARGEGWQEGEYCEFIYRGEEPITGKRSEEWYPSSPQWGPVQPCNGNSQHPIEVKVGTLEPGWRYTYTVVRCYEMVEEGSEKVCRPDYAYPYGYSRISECTPNWEKGTYPCPTFTTNLPRGETQPASAVLGTSATLSAKLQIEDLAHKPESGDVEYYFEYSTDSSLSSATRTPAQRLPENEAESEPTVSAHIEGLVPATTYYYRIVVLAPELNVNTPQRGAPLSLKTGGYALTLPATDTLENSATLNGEVAVGDNQLTYSWVINATGQTNAGILVPERVVAGGTLAPGVQQRVSAQISGLSAGTTYYAQLVTSEGAVHGEVISFSTSSPCAHESYRDHAIAGTGFVVSGCFSQSGPASEPTFTGYGTVQINGLEFAGNATSSLVINTHEHTLGAAAGHLQLGTLLLALAATWHYSDSTSGGETISTIEVAADPTTSFFGFAMAGEIAIAAHADGRSRVVAEVLGTPAIFGRATAKGEAWVSESGALQSLQVKIGEAEFGPLELPAIELSYEGANNEWVGTANLNFPMAKFGMTVTVRIKNGQLNGLGGSYSGPGLTLPGGIEITSIGFNSVFNPLQLEGSMGLGWGPEVGNATLFGGNLSFYIGFRANQTLTNVPGVEDGTVLHEVPLTLKLHGSLNLLGFIKLAEAQVAYYELPSPFITIFASLSEPLAVHCGGGELGVFPTLRLLGDGYGSEFNLIGEGRLAVALCGAKLKVAGAQIAISNRGAVFCGSFLENSVGVGFHWRGLPSNIEQLTEDFQLYGSGCGLEEYVQVLGLPKEDIASTAAARRSRATAGRPLILPPGLPYEVIKVRGAGAPPLVAISGPHGFSARSLADGQVAARRASYLVIPDKANQTTYIELTRPAAGAYRLTLLPGSAKVRSVAAARALPEPRLRARLRGRGTRRLLRWHASRRSGQIIRFVEIGGVGVHALLSTSASSGARRIRPLSGLAGKRSLLAEIYEHGVLARVVHIAAYSGPILPPPAQPGGLRATRSGSSLSITWRRAARAARYRIELVFPNHAVLSLKSESNRATVADVPASGTITVSVSGIDALQRAGRSATVVVGAQPSAKPPAHRVQRHRGHRHRAKRSRHRRR